MINDPNLLSQKADPNREFAVSFSGLAVVTINRAAGKGDWSEVVFTNHTEQGEIDLEDKWVVHNDISEEQKVNCTGCQYKLTNCQTQMVKNNRIK